MQSIDLCAQVLIVTIYYELIGLDILHVEGVLMRVCC
jgi:hypothetical protein